MLVGGGEPAAVPRLGEALTDCASPELWRLFGREFPEFFYYKSHISIMNGDFSTLIHLADPLRSPERVARFSPERGRPGYPWLGDGLFHLDRIAFDRAVYHKTLAQKPCRFIAAKIERVVMDGDRVARIELAGHDPIVDPKYVFDASRGLVAEALALKQTDLGAPQRVVFSHYRRAELDTHAPEWWRHGTNLLRLDREFDGLDAMSWLITNGKTLWVGMSFDSDGEHGNDDASALMDLLERAYRRRGLDYRPLYPEQHQPIQELRHTYFVRERAYGANWLLAGGGFINIWFPSSTGLWTATAAAGMAARLIKDPSLGRHYQKYMRGLVKLHSLWEKMAHGPHFKSSLQVYGFLARGMHFIPSRIAAYLRILDENYDGWLAPLNWLLEGIALLGSIVPPIMLLFGGLAVVRSRLMVDRSPGAPLAALFSFDSIPNLERDSRAAAILVERDSAPHAAAARSVRRQLSSLGRLQRRHALSRQERPQEYRQRDNQIQYAKRNRMEIQRQRRACRGRSGSIRMRASASTKNSVMNGQHAEPRNDSSRSAHALGRNQP